MLWVLIGSVSQRRFQWAPQQMFSCKNIAFLQLGKKKQLIQGNGASSRHTAVISFDCILKWRAFSLQGASMFWYKILLELENFVYRVYTY